MGCDIHLFIEHKNKEYPHWQGFGGEINPGRHYGIFAKLCGVRGYGEIKPITPPRGLPEGINYKVNNANTLFIDDDSPDGEGCCSSEMAERWIKEGISKRVSDHRITHPDWHSHSWVTTEELQKVLMELENVDTEWKAVLKVAMYFEELGEETRIVFWFDN
jgi:hypothetical protein